MGRRPLRRYYHRRNPDEHRRRLERAAASGDHQARAELFILDLRAGKPVEVIATEILSTLEVRELQALPGPMADDLARSMILAVNTRLDGNSGGWFPDHGLQNVCPRGHPVEQQGFDYTEVGMSWDRVVAATATTSYLRGDRDHNENSEEEWVQCRRCGAAWQSGEISYDEGEE